MPSTASIPAIETTPEFHRVLTCGGCGMIVGVHDGKRLRVGSSPPYAFLDSRCDVRCPCGFFKRWKPDQNGG